MFQLFKRRNFSEFVGDTFTFFNLYGKHYFKNYLIINGGLLLILLVLVYFVSQIFFEGFFSNISTGFSDNQLDAIINNNIGLFIGSGAFAMILILLISLLSYTYPVVYLNLSEKNTAFSTGDIVNAIKAKTGKVITFFLASLVIVFPLLAIGLALCFALIFIIIGIPIIMIFIPAFISWYSLSFYDYLSTNNGYFESLGRGWKMMQPKIWHVVGSTIIMYIIIQVAMGIITMIPYIMGVASIFTDLDNPNAVPNPEKFSFFMMMMVLVMVLSILLNFIFQNLLLVNHGIVYYSLREESENNTPKSEIDLIGTDRE